MTQFNRALSFLTRWYHIYIAALIGFLAGVAAGVHLLAWALGVPLPF